MKNRDEAKLRTILEEYESSPESVFGQGAGVELVRVIGKIAQVKRKLHRHPVRDGRDQGI